MLNLQSTTVGRFLAVVLLWSACNVRVPAAGRADEPSDARARGVIFGDVVGQNTSALRHRVEQLDVPADRFRLLSDWVLPSDAHGAIRLRGEFTPQGLYSPAIELVGSARRLGRIDQLRDRVDLLPDSQDEHQQRARLALRFILELAGGEPAAAEDAALKLAALVQHSPAVDSEQRWPQMVAACYGLRDPRHWQLVSDLVNEMWLRELLRQADEVDEAWAERVASLHGLLLFRREGRGDAFGAARPLPNWLLAGPLQARYNIKRFSRAHWHYDGDSLRNLSAGGPSLLFYKIPLRGDFEVSCELPEDAYEHVQVMYAGEYVGVAQEDFAHFQVGSANHSRTQRLDPAMTEPTGPPWLRVKVADGICTTWWNGRVLRRRQLVRDHDPWLAIRVSTSRLHPTIRNLRIDGTPRVPAAVDLCGDPDLKGWTSYYEEGPGSGRGWQQVRDERGNGLLAPRQPEHRGAHREDLFMYYRPLDVHDSVEFDFYYEEGKSGVHPAVDNRAFLLDPDGVRMHPLTQGKYDQGTTDPAATVVEPDARRGTGSLPLRQASWNRCRLARTEQAMNLFLNDQLVYSRPIPNHERGMFGFYRVAGETEVRIRDVTWRHDAAMAFDQVDHQFVSRGPASADAARLTAEFSHDFTTSGLPEDLFETPVGRSVEVRPGPEGVLHVQGSAGSWTDSSIVPRFHMRGDFEATVRFADLQLEEPKYGGAALVLRLEDGRVMMLSRRMRQESMHRVYLTWRKPAGDGQFRMVKQLIITEAMAGRLRVARRGDVYSFLIAEYDSPVFRLVGEERLEGTEGLAAGVELRAIASLSASARVVWKDLQIRAEQTDRYSFHAEEQALSKEQWAAIDQAPRLHELTLIRTDVADEDLARVKGHSELRRLYLQSTDVGSDGVKHLGDLKRLESLLLTTTRVDDEAGPTLGQLTRLQTLGLSYTRVGDATVRHLARLPDLEVLGLSGTAVTDASIPVLSEMKSLRRVNLRNTQLSEQGLQQLRAALPQCTIYE